MESALRAMFLEDQRETDTRTLARSALRAAACGEQRQLAVLLGEIERSARGPSHAVDRALARVARATVLALDGRAADADTELTEALHAAVSDRVDPELVMAAVRELGDVIVVTGTGRRRLASSSALVLPPDAVVLDARSDELTVRGARRSLHRYPVRRRLLYALARHPGSVLDKDALVEAVWGDAYDPLRHDDLIKANVLHLRRVLTGSGIAIVCGHPGYRLDAVAPHVFVFLSAFELGRAGSPRFTGASLPAIDRQ
jgi:DNA-binding response OmpR family regulator